MRTLVVLLAYMSSITLITCSNLPPPHTHHTPPLLHTAGVLADISPTLGSTQAVVREQVSNPQVGFDPTSVNATVNDSKCDTDKSLENFSDYSTIKFMSLSLFSLFSHSFIYLPFFFSFLLLLLPPSPLSSLLLPPPPFSSLLLLPPSSSQIQPLTLTQLLWTPTSTS